TSHARGMRDAAPRCMRATTLSKFVALPLGAVLAVGCATQRETGAVGGAAAGGLVGAAVGGETGALVGAALGGLGGYAIGREMDRRDQQRALWAIEQNRAMQWQ